MRTKGCESADPTPIAADESGRFELMPAMAIAQGVIGGNRRWIGVHRRFQRFSPAKLPIAITSAC
jgi:hypothetical protein